MNDPAIIALLAQLQEQAGGAPASEGAEKKE